MKNRYAVVLWVAACCLALPSRRVRPTGAFTDRPAPTWTIDQAVTCSVHDAWVLGGKNRAGFFAIVKALAELSAQKRGLILPDKETVGREFGEYIKTRRKPITISYCMQSWIGRCASTGTPAQRTRASSSSGMDR